MQCRDFREIADSYLSDELLIETNHDVIAHLEACADCRRELAARRELRTKLRAASVCAPELQPSDEFAARLRADLRAAALRQARAPQLSRGSWLAIAACLVVASAFGLTALRHQRQGAATPLQIASADREASTDKAAPQIPSERPTEAGLAVSMVMHAMANYAVGDHRDCAVAFRLPQRPITLEEAGRKYDRAYLDLVKAVMSGRDASTDPVEFIEAHSCVFEGRRFAHIVLKRHGRLVSFLVTDLDHLPEGAAKQTLSESQPSQQVIACSQIEGYRVSCFATARHAVFVVSDLSEAENLAIARALAPSVYRHLTRAEGFA